ncbi:MAG: LuxR C-terminal-related transcriptional regulator [Ectothiorhodospiraceae bacterium]|nr:LuxR C-terminal-related transcriptional regulator [Ectothiorhodospiraceae bacterium]
MSQGASSPRLASAFEALERGEWGAAREAFEEALAVHESADAYEGLSWAAMGLDDGEQAIRARQQAYRLYRDAGDNISAARMAIWAGKDHEDFRGEPAVARGWRQRAHRLLRDQPLAPEHGWLALMECWATLESGEDCAWVQQRACEAINVAEHCDEPDIGIVARAVEGLARVGVGQVDDGMKRLDESATAVFGGELRHEIWSLPVFCLLIFACQRVRDLSRAAQWCERMGEAAERIRHMGSQGICRTHYASILTSSGQWDEAETALAEAAECFAASWPPRVIEAKVRLAELHRRQGRHELAKTEFSRFDWHPLAMLGLAELALDAGQYDEADALVARFLRQIPESNRLSRAPGLELLVRILTTSGDIRRASGAMGELDALAATAGTDPLRGAACFAQALVARASGDTDRARAGLEDAVTLFGRGGTPFEAARARLELANLLMSGGELEPARNEAVAARQALEDLGAVSMLQRADRLLARINEQLAAGNHDAGTAMLTPRQIEVLRLAAQGLGDRDIAAALGISEHTVHRHMGNILLRLDAPTRAAAVALAARHNLL